jgi:CubicO group peptidase (beta-lactamase class C family)
MQRVRWWLVVAVWIAVAPAFGADGWAPAQRLDAYFDALAKHDLTSGSIAISEGGELRYQRTIGFARIENGKRDPADKVTRYRVGSVSKLFTAVLVMQLVEGGRVMLDSPLAEFYPDLPNALKLTYRDLLKHRSGLVDYTDEPTFDSWRTTPRTHEQMLDLITAGGNSFAPRERVEYNDSNYLLLGYTLEKVYSRSYGEIVRRQISNKLGLARTYLAGTGSAALESFSYQPNLDGSWGQVRDTDPSVLGGAAGMVSTASDLVRFMDALFTRRLVTEQSLTSMLNQDDGVGMGLWRYDIAGQEGYGHRGRTEGYRACVYHFPQRRLSIAYTSNASMLPIDELVDEVLMTIFDRAHVPPPLEPVKLTARQQADYLGTWASVDGSPRRTPFRSFRAPGHPIYLRMLAGTDTPVLRMMDHTYTLIPFGSDEFLSRELGLFLRFYPRSGEMVIRGPDWANYLKRSE